MKPTLSFSCALAPATAAIAKPAAAAAIMNFFIALSELLREALSGCGARMPRFALLNMRMILSEPAPTFRDHAPECSAVGHESKPERCWRWAARPPSPPRDRDQDNDGREIRQRRHQLRRNAHAHCLCMKLQDRDAAEQIGADHRAERQP